MATEKFMILNSRFLSLRPSFGRSLIGANNAQSASVLSFSARGIMIVLNCFDYFGFSNVRVDGYRLCSGKKTTGPVFGTQFSLHVRPVHQNVLHPCLMEKHLARSPKSFTTAISHDTTTPCPAATALWNAPPIRSSQFPLHTPRAVLPHAKV